MRNSLLFFLAFGSVQANNLLVNPSFEANTFTGYVAYLDHNTVPGWSVVTPGDSGLLVLGKNVDGTLAQDGGNFLVVDSFNAYEGVYQDVATEAGKVYDLSFYMHSGNFANAATDHEAVIVEWNGDTVGSYNAQTNSWNHIQTTVIGTVSSDRLTLRESTNAASDSSGPFIDKVVLTEQVAPPEVDQFGGGGGDPHFKTWTGLRYDYHGECDLVFLQNPDFDDGKGLHINIRTVRKGYYSYIERAALQLGDDILEFVGADEWYKNGVRASHRPKQKFGEYKLRVHSKSVSIRINEEKKIKIDLNQRRNGFLYLAVDGGSTVIFMGSLGMIGQWGSGQMMARDGVTVLSDPEAMAQEW